LLQCPACLGDLSHATESVRCRACGHSYLVVGGVPVFTVDEPAGTSVPSPRRPWINGVAHPAAEAGRLGRRSAALVRKLHGARPVTTNKQLQRAAGFMLRVLTFVTRPESWRAKLWRLQVALRRSRPLDFHEIDALLSSRDEHGGQSLSRA
jgi:hypothetical protein